MSAEQSPNAKPLQQDKAVSSVGALSDLQASGCGKR